MKTKINTPSLINKVVTRVRFSEVDSMQIVWHGQYVCYFEDGREAFGRQYKGIAYNDIYQSGYMSPIVILNLEYKHPLHIGDTIIIETRYINTEAAKICFEYIITRESDGKIVATGNTIQVFLNANNELELITPEFYNKWKEQWEVK